MLKVLINSEVARFFQQGRILTQIDSNTRVLR